MHPMRALLTAWSVAIAGSSAVVAETAPVRTAARADSVLQRGRVVHHFDFDERGEGNLEDIPKYWIPVRPDGFPGFAEGGFDFDLGGLAPPSFYLACNGRSAVYHYTGPETRVRPNSEYRIEGYVRPDRLASARACLSAHFLDRQGDPLLGTLVRSRYIGGVDEGRDWRRVELHLPAAPPEAFTVGLMVWVLQEAKWNTAVPRRRHIPKIDVHAGAWFDDITIHALPRVEISTSSPGNVLSPSGPQELRAFVADIEGRGLIGRLFITAADGRVAETHTIPATVGAFLEPIVIPVGHLAPGFYEARLDVHAGETLVASRRLSFVRLAPLRHEESAGGRAFGVVIRPEARTDVDEELALLRQQRVRSVKLPVWTGLAEPASTTITPPSIDRLVQGLVKGGVALTGVFFGPPAAIVHRDGTYPRPLIELLGEPPEVWQDYLAAVVAPHASLLRWWQVGSCAEDTPIDGKNLTRAVTQLREVMGRFISLPMLALPASSRIEPVQKKWPVEQVALSIGGEIQPNWFAPQIERYRDLGYEHVSVYLQPLPAGRYQRIPRLADWARRIITARFEGADTVFVPQPWDIRETAHGKVTEPTEEYIILRTIADTVADARPGQRVPVTPGVECLAFHDHQSTTLALWDAHAPPEGRSYHLQLGPAAEWIDLWGRTTTLDRDEDGRQIVPLSPVPILIRGVERWLIDFRTSLSLRPNHIESGTELARHTIELVHHGTAPISGNLYLEAPRLWEVTPRNRKFSLMPRRTQLLDVDVRYPHNEVAGWRNILAKIRLADDSYYLEVPLPVEIGLEGVEVSGMAVIEGGDLVVQHVVTNHTDSVLHLRGAAQVRGRQRQYRPLSNLQPGSTQRVDYRFAEAQDLAGGKVRVGLREINDGPRTHTLELSIP